MSTNMSETIYIKMEQNASVDKKTATIADIASVYSTNSSLVNKVKTIKVLTFEQDKKSRYIVSAMYVIQLIASQFPGVTIQNIGETDMLVEYKQNKTAQIKKPVEYTKVALVCIIIFFGAAFAIMTFNTDVNTTDLFQRLYYQFTGKQSSGFTIIEATYSIGLAVGIIVFYNHFGKKKITKDPTPIEVEMRKYEKDINTTLIDGVNRESCHKDVK